MLFVAMATVGAVILISCSEIVEPPKPPIAVLTGAPTGTNDTTVLSVTVSGDRVARYRHKVTEGTACTNEGYGPSTPVGNIIRDDISALEDGTVTLCVLGETDTGLRQTDPTKASWVKETPEPPEEPPTAVLTGAPTGTNDTTALAVTVSGDRVTRYRHKVTEGTACTNEGYGPSTPVGNIIRDDISALDDGPVTLCVLGETASGIRQTDPTKASWVKKTPEPPEEPPTAVLTGAPTGTNDITALSVTVSGDRVARYRHKVTAGTACAGEGYGPSTPVGNIIRDDISALEDGPVTLCVLGETASGVRQTEATKAGWTKETPEPPPKERYCRNGAAAESDPLSCKRGPWAMPGIDLIPLDMVKLTNKESQRMFALVDVLASHASVVGELTCKSYVTTESDCNDMDKRAKVVKTPDNSRIVTGGFSAFTHIMDLDPNHYGFVWLMSEVLNIGTVKVLAVPLTGGTPIFSDGWPYTPMPYLTVQGTGNDGENGWFLNMEEEWEIKLSNAGIAANKLIYVSGWKRDSSGRYTRHGDSNGCVGLPDGCIWAPYASPTFDWGTSGATGHFGASLGSVLSVFPDTTHQNLVEIAKACARKTGDGIEHLLRTSGGIGVADFSCMGPITDAARNLPAGRSTTVIVDGKTVTVTERELVVR